MAVVALCAAAAALAPATAGAQQRAARTSRPALPAALPSLAPSVAVPPAPLDEAGAIPPDPAPLSRGDLSESDPPVSAAASFGAPRERLPRPYPPRRAPYPPAFTPKTPLPPLEAYRTSWVARQKLRLRAPSPPAATASPPPPTVAAPPAPRAKPKPKAEATPFDPLGVKVGSTLILPRLELDAGYDDNPNRLAPELNPRPSAVLRGEGGVRVKSDWDRHSLDGELRGGYSEYPGYANASRPDATGALAGRVDVTRDTEIDVRGRLSLDTTRPGAPALLSGQPTVYVVNRPIVLGVGTQAGPTHRFGRLALSLRGTYDRVWYEDAKNNNGTTLNLASTSYNGYGVLMRAAYEATPDLQPFVEGTLDRRVHDSPVDFNGFYRDSKGFVVRGGADLKVSELVRGEISGGYGQRNYADPRLAPLRGPVIDAALIYTPSVLTTVTLRGSTTLNETTLIDASGALSRAVTATLSHDLMRNINITTTGTYFTNAYQGTNVRERGASMGVRLEYKPMRSVSIRVSYTHELLDSTFPNSDYNANVYLAGLRFQL
jgi:hypothetical protein